jgi:hypothetical protein
MIVSSNLTTRCEENGKDMFAFQIILLRSIYSEGARLVSNSFGCNLSHYVTTITSIMCIIRCITSHARITRMLLLHIMS